MIKPVPYIYIVDDDEAVRDALRQSLGGLGHPVQTFESGASFQNTCDLNGCGCVVLDLRMEFDTSGIQVFDALLACKSPLVVIFLSGHGDIPTALEQRDKGAFDWVVKSNIDKLKASVSAALPRAIQRKEAKLKWATLTPREKEVSYLVAEGKSDKEAARLLVPPVDARTVQTFKVSLKDKLEIDNASELLAWMTENAWLTAQ